MTDIEERVVRVVAETQHIDPATVKPGSTFEELGIDSFDGINLLFAIETEFDIHVPDEDAKKLRTVGEMIEGVERLVAAKGLAAGR